MMIQMIGIKKNTEVHIREQLSINAAELEGITRLLLSTCHELVIVSTCNRTEVYFCSEHLDEGVIKEVFAAVGWSYDLRQHVFHFNQRDAVKHLFEVACGFHSKIVGEDQILGQLKKSLQTARNLKSTGKYLSKLFEGAITCAKEFRSKSELHMLPISSSSIVTREAKQRDIRNYMIIGYGEVGQLTAKYILDSGFDKLYIAVRNPANVDLSGHNIHIIPFDDRSNYYSEVDCLISCTASPDIVVRKAELPAKKLLIFDLAVPRDVEEDAANDENIELFDIDRVSSLHDDTFSKRRDIMASNRHIIETNIEKYMHWLDIASLAGIIYKMQESTQFVSKERIKSFQNKMHVKDNLILAETMINSTSKVYLNRSIEVLKEEYKNGRGEECLNIIKKIFQLEN